MKKIIGFILMFVTIFPLIGCTSGPINTWEKIEERGYVIVGLDDTFAPMGLEIMQVISLDLMLI